MKQMMFGYKMEMARVAMWSDAEKRTSAISWTLYYLFWVWLLSIVPNSLYPLYAIGLVSFIGCYIIMVMTEYYTEGKYYDGAGM